jgi:hypothetical protein
MRIRNLFDPGSGMEKCGTGIRDKHPGSATEIFLMKIFDCYTPLEVGNLIYFN